MLCKVSLPLGPGLGPQTTTALGIGPSGEAPLAAIGFARIHRSRERMHSCCARLTIQREKKKKKHYGRNLACGSSFAAKRAQMFGFAVKTTLFVFFF